MQIRKSLIFFLLLFPFFLIAQNDVTTIQSITIIGNKKTKDKIIYRELDFKIGDEISLIDFEKRMKENERLVLNTGMFSKVEITSAQKNNQAAIQINVQENWYIYPIPLVELADRNFNVWWVEQNRKFNRLNLSMRFYHLNLTGNQDRLKILTQVGYTQKLELEYTYQGINKAQTIGLTTNLLFTRNKEIGYASFGNKLLFDREEDIFQLKRTRLGVGVIYRPGILFYHTGTVNYHQNNITDTVAIELNPDYFLDGREQQQYISLSYNLAYDNRDIKPYPETGSYSLVEIQKDGFGIFDDRNSLRLTAEVRKYLTHSKRWSSSISLKGRTELIRKKHSYYNSRALGYLEDFIRGYQYYVVDGQDYLYFKSSLRYKIVDREIQFGKWVFIDQFRVAPLKIYLTANYDGGRVWDEYYQENNPLTNTYLQGGSLGVDFVVYYDKVLRFEYSFNHLQEKALFLTYNLSF